MGRAILEFFLSIYDGDTSIWQILDWTDPGYGWNAIGGDQLGGDNKGPVNIVKEKGFAEESTQISYSWMTTCLYTVVMIAGGISVTFKIIFVFLVLKKKKKKKN